MEKVDEVFFPNVLKMRLERLRIHITQNKQQAQWIEYTKLARRFQKFTSQLNGLEINIILNDSFRKNYYSEYAAVNSVIRTLTVNYGVVGTGEDAQYVSDCREEDIQVNITSSIAFNFHFLIFSLG
jgi:hypothetical protein